MLKYVIGRILNVVSCISAHISLVDEMFLDKIHGRQLCQLYSPPMERAKMANNKKDDRIRYRETTEKNSRQRARWRQQQYHTHAKLNQTLQLNSMKCDVKFEEQREPKHD